MRFLVAVLAVAGFFAAVVFAGGNALGVWDRPPPDASAAEQLAAAPWLGPARSTTTDVNPPAPPPSNNVSGCAEAAKKGVDDGGSTALLARLNPRDPREQMNARDQKLARKAVLRRSNLGVCWTPVARSPNEGPVRCSGHNPDLSGLTITGRAGSAFVEGAAAFVSSVSIFASAGQASEYFRLTAARSALRCIRAELKRHLKGEGVSPRLKYARLQTEPPIAEQTAIYTLRYLITVDGYAGRGAYPLEIIVFRAGRAVGVVSVSGIGALDRELRMAQLVASRLSRS
jgi:hypothetical protein